MSNLVEELKKTKHLGKRQEYIYSGLAFQLFMFSGFWTIIRQ